MANVVVDDLSRKGRSVGSLSFIQVVEKTLGIDAQARQFDDPQLFDLKITVFRGGSKKLFIGDDGVFQLQCQISFRNMDGLREMILEEAHIYSGATMMYHDLKKHYWWRRMNKKWCWTCFVVFELSASHVRLSETRWFASKIRYPRVLSKFANFILVMTSYTSEKLAQIYIREILGTNLVHDALERVKSIEEQHRTTQSRKKSYVDRKFHDVAFIEGGKFLL
ncbi:uncharacterized protein [Nicotiana sylvestris]|uniref:uncharacterized protein n=1 Tax=Nicotiana sylvestris TaxID=4096 RepID=UPI00388CB1F5